MNTHTEEDHTSKLAADPNNCYVCHSDKMDSLAEIRAFAPVILQIETFVKQYRDGLILPHELVVSLAETGGDYL